MIDLNYDKIKQREYELVHYNGWLPFPLLLYIDSWERNNYLKSNGLFDEVQKQNKKYRYHVKQSGDVDAFEEKVLSKWIKQHPKFKNLVTFR